MTYLDIGVPPRIEENNVVARSDVQPYAAGFHGHKHDLDINIIGNGSKRRFSLSGVHSSIELNISDIIVFQKFCEKIQQ